MKKMKCPHNSRRADDDGQRVEAEDNNQSTATVFALNYSREANAFSALLQMATGERFIIALGQYVFHKNPVERALCCWDCRRIFLPPLEPRPDKPAILFLTRLAHELGHVADPLTCEERALLGSSRSPHSETWWNVTLRREATAWANARRLLSSLAEIAEFEEELWADFDKWKSHCDAEYERRRREDLGA